MSYECKCIESLIAAADAGDISAMQNFVVETLSSEEWDDNPVIIEKRNEYIEVLAREGKPEGFIFLGDIFLQGISVKKDVDKAIDYYELAANCGETFGYEIIAEIYIKGEDAPLNYEKAYELLDRSSELNNGVLRSDSGYYFMGEMYYFGLGVAKDWNKAKKSYKKIIRKYGNTGSDYYWKACARLASIYESVNDPDYKVYVENLKKVTKKHTEGMSDEQIKDSLGRY
ncbi:tetratricopeptide repeat protein [Butyrivibrio sp. AC2005]|uniref:tetratricopeptide repeat protein n=1 Tax=Butyrivibrio sp. AC2005 TaxID=1280672 RepID=UPI000414B30E|nr:tetratricopeptide repeat protein [Butyrivibrio sp. AC2005]